MELGINVWNWGAPVTTALVEKAAQKAADHGFDAVEVPIEQSDRLDPDRVREVLDDHDLGVTAVNTMVGDRDLIHPDADRRETGMTYMRDTIETAGAVGTDVLGGVFYSAIGRKWQATPTERERDLDLLEDRLADLSDYAADCGVVLAVEPINRFETSFCNTVEQGLEIVERVDHDHCQLLVDTFHMNIEEKDVEAAVRSAGSRIGHVHACGSDRGAPGNGHLDWEGIVAALEDTGYDGTLAVEAFTPEIESLAENAAVWRPVEPSQDSLAADAVANLRPLLE